MGPALHQAQCNCARFLLASKHRHAAPLAASISGGNAALRPPAGLEDGHHNRAGFAANVACLTSTRMPPQIPCLPRRPGDGGHRHQRAGPRLRQALPGAATVPALFFCTCSRAAEALGTPAHACSCCLSRTAANSPHETTCRAHLAPRLHTAAHSRLDATECYAARSQVGRTLFTSYLATNLNQPAGRGDPRRLPAPHPGRHPRRPAALRAQVGRQASALVRK